MPVLRRAYNVAQGRNETPGLRSSTRTREGGPQGQDLPHLLSLKSSRPFALRSLLPSPMTAQGINYTIVNGECSAKTANTPALPGQVVCAERMNWK